MKIDIIVIGNAGNCYYYFNCRCGENKFD